MKKLLSENLAMLEFWLRSNGRDKFADQVKTAAKVVKVLEERKKDGASSD